MLNQIVKNDSVSYRVKKKRERFLFLQILRFVRNVRRNFMIRRTEGISIHLLTVPAVDRVLLF